MMYDNFVMANSFRCQSMMTKVRRHNNIRDVAAVSAGLFDIRQSFETPPADIPMAPVDHLTGSLLFSCLDRLQTLADEREQVTSKVQALARQMGVEVPRDDPLAALDIIGQRYQDLSAGLHHELTSNKQTMMTAEQRANEAEPVESRDRDKDDHVIQRSHHNEDDSDGLPCATPNPCTLATPPVFFPSSPPRAITPPLPTPEWYTNSPSSSFNFQTMPTPPGLIYPPSHPCHTTPPPTAMPHPVTSPPSDTITPPLPLPEWFTSSSPRPITIGSHHSSHRGATPSPVLGAVGGPTPSSATGAGPVPPAPAIIVWDVDQLSPFDRSRGDIELGKGAYGTVRLFRDKATRTPLAVKIFTLPSDNDLMVRRVQDIQDETAVQAFLGCQPYFPTYHGCVEMAIGEVGIVMEFIGDRDTGETIPLGKVLYTGSPVLSKKDWFSVANDLAQAVRFVHDSGYLLNDLKEDNVLLSRSDRGWHAVVIDFGWVSRQSQPQFFTFSDQTKGKYANEKLYEHIAPECALLDEGTSTVSDVFQVGRLIRLISVRSGDIKLLAIGDMCCHTTAMFRPTIVEVDRELDRLLPSY